MDARADGALVLHRLLAAFARAEAKDADQARTSVEGAVFDAAQRLIYLKGRDSHDYKFSSAVLEDYHHLSPDLRSRFLASSTFWFEGSGKPDNALVARTRAAFG